MTKANLPDASSIVCPHPHVPGRNVDKAYQGGVNAALPVAKHRRTKVITAATLRDQLAAHWRPALPSRTLLCQPGFGLFKQLLTLFAAIACRRDGDE
jgi:hypothetical protein